MKDMSDSSLSVYGGVEWSAPDDTTIEGEFPLAPLYLRYTKATRRLHLRLTEISVLETWGQPSRVGAGAPTQELTARGELAEVLTVFELDGVQVRQFREVQRVTITASPLGSHADPASQQRADQDLPEMAGPQGVLFVDFEALRVHGEHPDLTLTLIMSMGEAEFRQVYAMVSERAEEIRDMTLVLDADLFGDDLGPDEAWSGWTPEYGMLRSADTPLVYAPARLDRMDVVLARSRVLKAEPVAPASPLNASPRRMDQPDDGPALVSRRLGWIIAFIVVIIVTMLIEKGGADRVQRPQRQFAEHIQPSTRVAEADHVAALSTSILADRPSPALFRTSQKFDKVTLCENHIEHIADA